MLDSTTPAREAAALGTAAAEPVVRHFRQVLLWPLRLMPCEEGVGDRRPWRRLAAQPGSPWRELRADPAGEAAGFREGHYQEFLSFLPYVQRFLYGEGRRSGTTPDDEEGHGDAPMRVLRRDDVSAVRVQTRAGAEPLTLDVVRVDLYFFFDVDVAMLAVEIAADALPLGLAQELLYRLGRAYPSGWDAAGRAQHDLQRVEWLGAGGAVLAASDCERREAYLEFVGRHRTPRVASHWSWLLKPMVHDLADPSGALGYRPIETHRMAVMGYLALDDPLALTRNDFIRLGLTTGAGSRPGGRDGAAALPYAAQHLADFEARYCYDRFWMDAGAAPNTRYLCNGHALIVVGDARSEFYGCRDRGVLAQFRHQHFLLFLIAHFQKASLLMFSDQLVEALKRLDIRSTSSVKRFKRAIRASFERFLRFTHRYWFHEISQQAQVKALSHLCARHLGTDALYEEVRERIGDMNTYLDADSLRRQANTVVRLTVVTLFGLIGTITTGFLGMNLLAEADAPLGRKLAYFAVVGALTTWLTVYTMIKSKRLSDFIDSLSDDRQTLRGKFASFVNVWRRGAE